MYVYALMEPDTDDVRYVGFTSKTPEHRLKRHLRTARQRGGTHRLNWIRSLVKRGKTPRIVVLEKVNDDDWQERERHWIARMRDAGHGLTNMTDGGHGLINPSKGVREKLAGAARGNNYATGKRSDAFRERRAQVAKGNRNALGHTVSDETRQEISEKLKEYYANGGEAVRGEENGSSRVTEDQVREIRKRHAQGASMRGMVNDYPITYSAIRKIVTRQTWAHVE